MVDSKSERSACASPLGKSQGVCDERSERGLERGRLAWHLLIAVVLTLTGITLLFMSFLVPPEGEIHSSVLVAFGEVSTFAGALFGVDFRYRHQREERKRNLE